MFKFYVRVKNRVRRFFGLRVRIVPPLRRGVVSRASLPYGQGVYDVDDGADYVRSVRDVHERSAELEREFYVPARKYMDILNDAYDEHVGKVKGSAE